jgi:hypothetical protein
VKPEQPFRVANAATDRVLMRIMRADLLSTGTGQEAPSAPHFGLHERSMPDPRKTTMLDALDLLARVEGQSRVLRGLGRKSRPVLVQGRFAIARDTPRDGLPFALPDAAVAMDGAAWVRADVLIVGRVPTRRLILRAFYADVGITVAIHGRLRLSRRSALLRGARVARRLHGRGTLAIPEQRERGRRPVMRGRWRSCCPAAKWFIASGRRRSCG